MNDKEKDWIATGKRIHHKMIDCGVKQKEIARAAGCKPQMVWKVVHGKCRATKAILHAAAKLMDCKVDELQH